MARMPGEKPATELKRVLFHFVRHFVDKTFDDESGVGMADRAPPLDRNGEGRAVQIDEDVGNLVWNIFGPFHRRGINPIVGEAAFEWRSFQDRLAHHRMLPGNQFSARIKSRSNPVVPHRTIVAPFDIILPGPDDFNRLLDRFGNLDSFNHEIRLRVRPAAEAATQIGCVKRDIFLLESRDPRGGVPIGSLKLGSGLDLTAVVV